MDVRRTASLGGLPSMYPSPRYTIHERVLYFKLFFKITNSGWGNDTIPDNKLVEASAADAVR